jgi:trk system potassium uptake protein TrkA
VKIVIVGCGRVGAVLAEALDAAGEDVTIIDVSTRAFERLPEEFKGQAIRADGTDEDALRRAGAEGADVLLALTEGDNRNVMAAELAVENLGVKKAMAKVNDPVRAAAYAELGIATICRTTMLLDAIQGFLGMAPTGLPSIIPAVAPHHEGGHAAGASGTGLGAGMGTRATPGTAATPGTSAVGPSSAGEG